MNRTSTIDVAARSGSQIRYSNRIADFIALSKPRIAILELVVVASSASIAAPHGLAYSVLAAALVGTALVAASASAMNQWIERFADARMPRTANRPLPAGRVSPVEACVFALVCGVLGLALLWFGARPLAAAMAFVTWFVYVAVYTPLKQRSTSNTAVGAVAGALPVLIGWTAAGGPIDFAAVAVTMLVYVWQFPHFMAIAWMYREQYAAGRMRMSTVVDPSGLAAGHVAVVGALALLPISLLPVLNPWSSNVVIYAFWAIMLGLGQAACAGLFLLRRDDLSARWLLRASLVYLPCMFLLLLFTR